MPLLAKTADGLALSKNAAQLDELDSALNDALHGTERVSEILGTLRTLSSTQVHPKEEIDLRAVLTTELTAKRSEVDARATLNCDFRDTPRVEANAGHSPKSSGISCRTPSRRYRRASRGKTSFSS